MKLLGRDKLIMQVSVGNSKDKDDTKVILSWKELCEMAIDFKKKEEANEKSPAATKQQD